MKLKTLICKVFLFIQILLFFTFASNAQIKICEEKLFWGSECYQIRADSSFIYNYSHCTGSVIGKGHYTKTKKNITFHFEDVVSPLVKKTNNLQRNNEVSITLLYTGDETSILWLHTPLDYEGQKIWIGDGKSTFEYSDKPIVIHHPFYPFPKDSIVLMPQKESYNEYKIFWHLSGDSFIEGGKTVTMEKIGKKYKHIKKVGESNEDSNYREVIYKRVKESKQK